MLICYGLTCAIRTSLACYACVVAIQSVGGHGRSHRADIHTIVAAFQNFAKTVFMSTTMESELSAIEKGTPVIERCLVVIIMHHDKALTNTSRMPWKASGKRFMKTGTEIIMRRMRWKASGMRSTKTGTETIGTDIETTMTDMEIIMVDIDIITMSLLNEGMTDLKTMYVSSFVAAKRLLINHFAFRTEVTDPTSESAASAMKEALYVVSYCVWRDSDIRRCPYMDHDITTGPLARPHLHKPRRAS